MKLYKLPFYGIAYRSLMRVAHRFDWHYAPEIGPLDAGPNDPRTGMYQRWCKWCGFRESFIKPGSRLWNDSLAKLNENRGGPCVLRE
jgi:hypothetical protein